MNDKNYIDGYQSNDLPLFRKGRENQIKDMVGFVEKFTDWEKFKSLHKNKPEIYKEFCRVTDALISRGHKQYSAYGVMHIVRFSVWKEGVTMQPEEDFKISNNMTPFYARLYIRDFPEHEDFFVTKPIKVQGFKEEWISSL
tara:strand:- start:701 stop:1123 length:423 start_codon:yes stop_codon:yes gene_type:complete